MILPVALRECLIKNGDKLTEIELITRLESLIKLEKEYQEAQSMEQLKILYTTRIMENLTKLRLTDMESEFCDGLKPMLTQISRDFLTSNDSTPIVNPLLKKKKKVNKE
jgi:hypothetical protein